ncbi:MAG: 50S ribosomal protein L35ae [Candidatus Altiarchaeales archaeon ex4484_2]|nr:MAG: 50S ribosomal protein L35ae [Candidatus Altiarchaeales archaeon ex4484_2]
MKAVILNYRQGKRTQSTNQLIVKPEGSSSKEDASKLLGKSVEWTTPSGKKIVGKVTRVHGRNGTVIAKFNKGLPGQALSTKAEII